MAVSAVLAESPGMRVVSSVAGDAVAGYLRVPAAGVRMTVAAAERLMRSGQLEVGQRVIENPGSPARRIMAGGALIAETAFMRIVVAMARDAALARIMERRRCMALVAADIGVRAQ